LFLTTIKQDNDTGAIPKNPITVLFERIIEIVPLLIYSLYFIIPQCTLLIDLKSAFKQSKALTTLA
jgi:hypothetical protein